MYLWIAERNTSFFGLSYSKLWADYLMWMWTRKVNNSVFVWSNVSVKRYMFQEEDREQLSSFLKDLLCTLSLCHASLDSIKAAFSELR